MSNYDALPNDEQRRAAAALAKYLILTPESPVYGHPFSKICEGIAGNPEMLAHALEYQNRDKNLTQAVAQEGADRFFREHMDEAVSAAASDWQRKVAAEQSAQKDKGLKR